MKKRDLLALLTAVIGILVVMHGSVLETGSWGLSFRQEGAPPIGNAGADQLRQYSAAYLDDTTEKVLYLTFDAGYENGCTEKILDTLKNHSIKAAFFLFLKWGCQIPAAPEQEAEPQGRGNLQDAEA